MDLMVLDRLPGAGVPEDEVRCRAEQSGGALAGCLSYGDDGNEIGDSKDLVHQFPDMVQVLVADLHEAAPALVQQLTGKKQAVPQV